MIKAKLISQTDPDHPKTLAKILADGGIVGSIWGFHLYFLSCNAFNKKSVARLNQIKGRQKGQVLASPGAEDEAEEFSDLTKNKALLRSAKEMKFTPKAYLRFLFNKFPLAVELFANKNAPPSVTFTTKLGKTIWVVGHNSDQNYRRFLDEVRSIRRDEGKKVSFAGASLNLTGDNTLTIRDFEMVLKEFGDLVDVLLVHPDSRKIKKLKYGTSCSVVSFIDMQPMLTRLGSTSFQTLKKYIPGLQVSEHLTKTRKATSAG